MSKVATVKHWQPLGDALVSIHDYAFPNDDAARAFFKENHTDGVSSLKTIDGKVEWRDADGNPWPPPANAKAKEAEPAKGGEAAKTGGKDTTAEAQ